MARQSYADATIEEVEPNTWRIKADRRDGFRITFTPGVILVHGGYDPVVFRHYQACPNLWEAVTWACRADFSYLMEKSNLSREFDRDKTVQNILYRADDEMKGTDKGDDLSIWKGLVDHYEWYGDNHRNGATQMKAAKALREDCELTPHKMGEMFSDIDEWYSMIGESWPPKGRWAYEAVQIWAATMLHHEPCWHRLWRRFKREKANIRWRIKSGLLWRPEIYVPARNAQTYGYSGFAQAVRWKWDDGESWRGVSPFRAFGISFERIGLFCLSGGSRPIRKPEDKTEFVPAAQGRAT